jgi:Fic family protein
MTFDPIRPFKLPPLPPVLNFKDERFVDVLLKTRTELGELNGYLHSVPNPMLLLSPTILRESVASAEIENINTTIDQVLQMQIFPETEQRPADKEVLRYSQAIHWGFEQLKNLPISSRLVQGIHKRLLPDAHGGYRRAQNAISNTANDKILYTPPPANDVPQLMGDWENFLHREDGIDPLVKCAIAHYQFEAIHPFGDGNGRVGRILMVLYLIEQKLLSLPILYISGYINANRSEYYRGLREISSDQKWVEFILYMLKGFHQQSRDTKANLLKLVELLQKTKDRIRKKHKPIYTGDLVEALFAAPIITPVNLGRRLDVNYRTASRYLSALAKSGILKESRMGRYHIFINKLLLDLLGK